MTDLGLRKEALEALVASERGWTVRTGQPRVAHFQPYGDPDTAGFVYSLPKPIISQYA